MARAVFLVENILSEIQFPAHVLTATSEAADAQAWRVATGRRSPRDRWTPAVLNTQAWIHVDCGVERTVDMLALDRGHNLAGRVVTGGALMLERSADNVAWTTVFSIHPPAAAAAGSSVDAVSGALTHEGAWVKRFTAASARYWRIRVRPLGAGLRPEIVGAWLGKSYSPQLFFDLPIRSAGAQLRFEERVSDHGWAGTSTIARARAGTIVLKTYTDAEAAEAAYHFDTHFWWRRPMWILYDAARAENAVLAVPPSGEVGFEVQRGWSRPQAEIQWTEHEPRLP